MPGQTFERDVVHAFNDYFTRDKVKAIAYRHYQMRFQPQLFDVLVDCRGNELYLALECKSVDTSTYNGVYFSAHFSNQKGVHQVERETDWLTQSGRNGFLVVEARRPRPLKTTAFFVPWRLLTIARANKVPNIHSDQITRCPFCDKSGGKYLIDDEFIKELVLSLDSYPKNPKKVTKRSSW